MLTQSLKVHRRASVRFLMTHDIMGGTWDINSWPTEDAMMMMSIVP